MSLTITNTILSSAILFIVVLISIRLYAFIQKKLSLKKRVAFFHPYCDSGGGGERVLWLALLELQSSYPQHQYIIYTGDTQPQHIILKRAQDRFSLSKSIGEVTFVRLKCRVLVEDKLYPRFTMLGQSIGSMILCIESLLRMNCDVYIDTTGFAFTYLIAKYLFGCDIICYTHYPTISTDMLNLVQQRYTTYNNIGIAASVWKSYLKLLYYKCFAYMYGCVGSCAEIVMVNSTWTYQHIQHIWNPRNVQIVYPPCDTSTLRELPLTYPAVRGNHKSNSGVRERLIISVSQFRPEKNHMLQIEAFKLFWEQYQKHIKSSRKKNEDNDDLNVRLVMIGGCRNDEDMNRVAKLKEKVVEYGLENQIGFAINVSFEELKHYYSCALAGLHTMWNEHFGISVVELMAAGVLTIAHNTAGPAMDIVVKDAQGQPTGWLAAQPQEYADALMQIINNYDNEEFSLALRQRARDHVVKFSDENFRSHFIRCLRPLL